MLLGIFSFGVLFLCFHEFQFHILFCFDFFFFCLLSESLEKRENRFGTTQKTNPPQKKKKLEREFARGRVHWPYACQSKVRFPTTIRLLWPYGNFFFLIIKIYAFGCILIFGWIDIDLDVWVKFDFILILTHVHQKFTFNF